MLLTPDATPRGNQARSAGLAQLERQSTAAARAMGDAAGAARPLGGALAAFSAVSRGLGDLARALQHAGDAAAKFAAPAKGESGGGGSVPIAVDPANTAATAEGFEAMTAQATQLATVVRTSLTQGFQPLRANLEFIRKEFNIAAGAGVTMARRIDAAMKMPAILATFDAVSRGSDKARASLGKLAEVAAGLGGSGITAALDAMAARLEKIAASSDGAGAQAAAMAAKTAQAMSAAGKGDAGARIAKSIGAAAVPLAAFVAFGPSLGTVAAALKLAAGAGVGLAAGAPGLTAVAASYAGVAGKAILLAAAMKPIVVAGKAAYQSISYIKSAGDPAGKTLSRIAHVTFAAPTQGVAALGKATGNAAISFKGLGREIAVSLGATALVYKMTTAVKDFIVGGIGGASDLNETFNATKQIFGDSAGAITAQADRMAAKFGIVKGEQLGIANAFGSIAQAGKFSTEESANFANSMTKLAADFSSFKNLSFDDAADKLRSALTGEGKPLKEYGVLLNEEAVKAEVFRMGLAKTADAITEGAKIRARASLISKQMANAEGDLERTQYDAANQFRKSSGGLTNFANSIGQLLLPGVAALTTGFNDMLASIIETFEANRPLIEAWSGAVVDAFAKVGEYMRNYDLTWQLLKVTAAEAVATITAYVQSMPGNFGKVAEWLGNNWYNLIYDAFQAAWKVVENFFGNLNKLGTALGEWWADPFAGFPEVKFDSLLKDFKATTEKLPELMLPAWQRMDKEREAIGKQWATREAERAKRIADEMGAIQKKPLQLDEGSGPTQFAKLAEVNDKEAYQAVMKHQYDRSGEAPIKEVAKLSREQLAEQRKTRQVLEKAFERAVSSPLDAYDEF